MTTAIFYVGGITDVGARNLLSAAVGAMAKGEREILLCLASGGGDVSAGIGIYNFFRMVPVTVNTHALGMCGSIAATIYLCGQRRTAAHASMFSLHAATFNGGPRAGDIAENTAMISGPFKTLGWSDGQIANYFGSKDEKFLVPQFAKEMGMVTSIEDLRLPSQVEIVVVGM